MSTGNEMNDKKWEEHWNGLIDYLRDRLEDCIYLSDEHSVGIHRGRRSFQVYGAKESFKFEDNSKVLIKAENKKTGKFVQVYEYDIYSKEIKRCSQAHLIHNTYKEDDLKFLQDLKKGILDYYRPNSIKFITD